MSDIVARLRDKWRHSEEDCYEASDEIVRLRGEVERLTREMDWHKSLTQSHDLLADNAAQKTRAEAAEAEVKKWKDELREADKMLLNQARTIRERDEASEDASVARQSLYEVCKQRNAALARAEAAEAKIAKLREALTPFVEAYENTIACDDDKWRDKDSLWESAAAMVLCAGDLRRARAVLQETEQ